MSRAARLLDLMQVLRRHRQPIQGAALAQQLGISLRTLYRDIATLQAQGAQIEGEAGLGYVLKPGFVLPPLMFSADELEALVLGSRWVAGRSDDAALAEAARNALAKISAVLPPDLRFELDSSALLVGPGSSLEASSNALSSLSDDSVQATLRKAMRNERKLMLHYLDLKGAASERIVWPFALGFFDSARVLVAWCELRQATRNFRLDRIESMQVLAQRYPRPRQALLAEWRAAEGIAPQ
ncbi:helix-turn-helix transcriptional regulator [Paucibacter sp. Y2R2-4]|uniref:helix-turn-helix transcriptional regulator n=1 Tax=Paucibacter sp. Y2R2-4 TaxID=2893553 RepID=UPI0021E3E399|nr:YafY family protein [Paucibacter sp. Y2R2-4]MCV2348800.1 YafY family transcriptional regulator [Paucibacter sp. Y2R2-4]